MGKGRIKKSKRKGQSANIRENRKNVEKGGEGRGGKGRSSEEIERAWERVEGSDGRGRGREKGERKGQMA